MKYVMAVMVVIRPTASPLLLLLLTGDWVDFAVVCTTTAGTDAALIGQDHIVMAWPVPPPL